MKKTLVVVSALVAGLLSVSAHVTLPPAYTDHMVLQQKTTFDLSGHAAPGSDVTLRAGWLRKAPLTTQADAQGVWTLTLTTPRAGGPYTLEVTDSDGALTLSDVLVGEVWFCSGQSNMEMPVQSVRDAEAEIAAASYPSIRLYKVTHNIPLQPTDEASSQLDGWQACSPQTIPNFSAVAYFYARELWQKLGIPVGVIDSSWGGTSAEAWISAEAMEGVMDFEEHMQMMRDNGYDADRLMTCYEKAQADFQAAFDSADPGLNAECTPWYDEDLDDSSWGTLTVPGLWAGKLGTFDGSLWMRREVMISAENAGKDLPLHMGVIDDNEITWWNGECVGMTEGWLATRDYVVPGRLVREGRNVLCVRIEDTGADGGVRGGEFSYPGEWKYRIGYDRAALNPLRIPITRPKNDPNYPTVLYNGMVHPFITFPIQGCIWYQGCNNVGRATQYEALMQTLITDWRQRFGRPDMPFYIVQLANYLQRYDLQPDSEWALLREAQNKAAQMQGVGVASIIDIGEANDIHPKNKQEVGRRMAALALHQVYGKKKVVCGAPVYAYSEVTGNEMRLHFCRPDGCEPFLPATDLPGFIIAGADHQWHVAKARTEGDQVVVSSPDVTVPLAVRYGWADNPECTLHTASGFPVSPFRTDSW
ncbi:MAG: sialate O-acetylesterase [Bacteroidales bacterium]|nr:sialate O-acetylesterase [Bacteroidales bacterium]